MCIFHNFYIIFKIKLLIREIDLKITVEFEGEYLNGELNGKIKEYHNGILLLFEGEYLNEKKMEKEKNMIMMVN